MNLIKTKHKTEKGVIKGKACASLTFSFTHVPFPHILSYSLGVTLCRLVGSSLGLLFFVIIEIKQGTRVYFN